MGTAADPEPSRPPSGSTDWAMRSAASISRADIAGTAASSQRATGTLTTRAARTLPPRRSPGRPATRRACHAESRSRRPGLDRARRRPTRARGRRRPPDTAPRAQLGEHGQAARRVVRSADRARLVDHARLPVGDHRIEHGRFALTQLDELGRLPHLIDEPLHEQPGPLAQQMRDAGVDRANHRVLGDVRAPQLPRDGAAVEDQHAVAQVLCSICSVDMTMTILPDSASSRISP